MTRLKTKRKATSAAVAKKTRKNTSISSDDVISLSSTETPPLAVSKNEYRFSSDIFNAVRKRMIGDVWNVPTLTQHISEYQRSLVELMQRCVEWKESNSILIEGPIGSGKRSLVRNAIAEFKSVTTSTVSSKKGGTQNKCAMKFVILNGLLVSDVKTCLKEISRQLLMRQPGDKSASPEGDVQMHGSDEESSKDDDDGENGADSEMQRLSVTNSLAFVLQTLHSNRDDKSSNIENGVEGLVFVLESFEHFVQSKSQMLLYNLFDTCQSLRTPLVVIGISNRLDVSELLEKRVKSRFSHRSISLWNNLTFAQWTACAQELLSVDEASVKTSKRKVCPPSPERTWNEFVANLLQSEKFIVGLERLHLSFPTITCLKHVLFTFIIRSRRLLSQLASRYSDESGLIFENCVEELSRGAHSKLNQNLSHCELVMISAMKKIVEREEIEWVTFGLVYQEYCTFAKRNPSHRGIERNLAMNSFESLLEMKVIHTSDNRTNNRSMLKCYRKYKLLLDVYQLNDIIRNHPYCPSIVKMWALGLSDQ